MAGFVYYIRTIGGENDGEGMPLCHFIPTYESATIQLL